MDPTAVLEPQPEHVYLIIATYPNGDTETSIARYSHRDGERAYWVSPLMTTGPAKVDIVRELVSTAEDTV